MDTNVLCLIECPEFVSIRVNSWLAVCAQALLVTGQHACHAVASREGSYFLILLPTFWLAPLIQGFFSAEIIPFPAEFALRCRRA